MFRLQAVFLILSAAALSAQSNPNVPLQFRISPAPGWTDTGLDLQAGDVLTISAASIPSERADSSFPVCSPAGFPSTASRSDFPLPSAPVGALIARLHALDAAPVLIGNGTDLHINDPSHLFLGMNSTGMPLCQGGLTVTVQKATSANNANQTRGAQLKSQLSNAMGIFMAGQFGLKPGGANASSSSATSAAPLTISDRPLDADLRKKLDTLPRRVNDQLNHLGDMVNFVIVGSQKDMQSALDAATWHLADTDNTAAVFNAVRQASDSKDYLAMPMSTLYLFGRKQDFGYEMAEPIAMVASRHHFRLWKAPFTWDGQEVWVGAGTHDIGFAKDQRNNSVTHKIDPAVDGERDNIGSSLQKANKAKSEAYYLPPDPVQEAKNATGDSYHSDGRLLVIFLQ